jgi:hypothetical protein
MLIGLEEIQNRDSSALGAFAKGADASLHIPNSFGSAFRKLCTL